jgi:hypothetical protein
VEVALAWRLVAGPDGTENFPKAYVGMESLSSGLMQMIGKIYVHSSLRSEISCPTHLPKQSRFVFSSPSVDGVFWYTKHVHYTLVCI